MLEANKKDPEKCAAITDRLNSVTLPFHELVSKLEDKQKKLGAIKKAVDKYNTEKEPLEELITATEQKVDNLEPFGLDVEKGENEVKELEVRSNLLHIKRTMNVSGFLRVVLILVILL